MVFDVVEYIGVILNHRVPVQLIIPEFSSNFIVQIMGGRLGSRLIMLAVLAGSRAYNFFLRFEFF